MRRLKNIVSLIFVFLPIIVFCINMVITIMSLYSWRVSVLSTIPFTYLSFDFHLKLIIIRYAIFIMTIVFAIVFLLKKNKIFIVINALLSIIFISDIFYLIDLVEFVV